MIIMSFIETAMKSRGLTDDSLLNALDTAESILNVNGSITDQGIVTLYHATSPEAAQAIIREQKMYGKEDGLFFSTSPNGQIIGYGNTVISVKIPVEMLKLEDDFGDELHFRLEVRPNQKVSLDISTYSI